MKPPKPGILTTCTVELVEQDEADLAPVVDDRRPHRGVEALAQQAQERARSMSVCASRSAIANGVVADVDDGREQHLGAGVGDAIDLAADLRAVRLDVGDQLASRRRPGTCGYSAKTSFAPIITVAMSPALQRAFRLLRVDLPGEVGGARAERRADAAGRRGDRRRARVALREDEAVERGDALDQIALRPQTTVGSVVDTVALTLYLLPLASLRVSTMRLDSSPKAITRVAWKRVCRLARRRRRRPRAASPRPGPQRPRGARARPSNSLSFQKAPGWG